MRDLVAVAEIKLWAPARTDDPEEVLCRGMIRSGSVWVRVAVRRGPAGITVSYPNRRGRALAWPDESERPRMDRVIIAEARREGWVP